MWLERAGQSATQTLRTELFAWWVAAHEGSQAPFRICSRFCSQLLRFAQKCVAASGSRRFTDRVASGRRTVVGCLRKPIQDDFVWMVPLIAAIVSTSPGCKSTSAQAGFRVALCDAERGAQARDAHPLLSTLVRDDDSPVSEQEVAELRSELGDTLRERLYRACLASASASSYFQYKLDNGSEISTVVRDGVARVHSFPHTRGCATTVFLALMALRESVSSRTCKSWLWMPALSARARQDWELEWAALQSGLAFPEVLEVESNGASAHVALPSGRIVDFVRENGCWKVDRM